jgi:hypothetical protein
MDHLGRTAWHLRLGSGDWVAVASDEEPLDCGQRPGALNNWGQYAFKFVSGEGQPIDGLVLASGSLALIALGAILVFREI